MIISKGFVFISSKCRVTKGFEFHARPRTGAYSCCNCSSVPSQLCAIFEFECEKSEKEKKI